MNKESLENKAADTQGVEKEATPDVLGNSYQRYLELGGIINEKDFQRALETAVDNPIFRNLLKDKSPLGAELRSSIKQVENIAKFAGISGIESHSTEDAIDPRVLLYVVLRSDVMPEDVKNPPVQTSDQRASVYHDGVLPDYANPKEVRHHHSQMSDQRIFMEALRMRGDTESIAKMIEAYPNISFKYERGE